MTSLMVTKITMPINTMKEILMIFCSNLGFIGFPLIDSKNKNTNLPPSKAGIGKILNMAKAKEIMAISKNTC